MSAGNSVKNRSKHKNNLQMFLDFTGMSARQILDEYMTGSKKQFKTFSVAAGFHGTPATTRL